VSVVKTKELESALVGKGFRQDNTHHRFFWLFDGEKKTSVKTYVSHGVREYGDELLDKVKKQLGLTKPQLLDLIACPMTEHDYLEHLLNIGRIRRPPAHGE